MQERFDLCLQRVLEVHDRIHVQQFNEGRDTRESAHGQDMPILNDGFNFRQTPLNDRLAFLGTVEGVRLKSGVKLYLLTTNNFNNVLAVTWWYSALSFTDVVRSVRTDVRLS